jgi:hypothetical protein
MNFRNIFLKNAVCLFILCLGFVLGSWSHTVRHQIDNSHWNYPECNQIDDFHQFVYLYDTEQKLEDFYKMMVRVTLDETGWHPESPEARWTSDSLRHERPLVKVGPFVVFISNDNRRFSVHQQSSRRPLVALSSDESPVTGEQYKLLTFASPLEKNWSAPRFMAHLRYSEDCVYKSGSFSVRVKEGFVDRTYHDDTGSGVFDTMGVWEDGAPATYRLNRLTLTWEREVPVPQPPLLPGTESPPPMGILPPGTTFPQRSPFLP